MKSAISKPYHFLGYWGYGQQSKLTKLLDQILAPKRIAKQSSYQNNGLIWNVAYISNDEIATDIFSTTEKTIIAGLSASGIHSQPEAWAKVQNECLILGREPFGRVTLYWTKKEDVIWFASQLQLLLTVIENPQISISGLYGYSCFSYIPTPLSPINDIFAVPAGTELIWQGKPLTYKSRRLLQWQEAPVLLSDENQATLQLQTLLKDTIQRQIADLNSDSVGVFLSGGIDSSTVAALLVQAGIKVKAYALDFEPVLVNKSLSEFGYAQQVASFLNIPLVKVSVTAEKIKKAITATAQCLDIPFGDGAPLPLYLLTQVARQESSVIFNGENGDQLFAGWTNKPLIAASIYNTENPSGFKNFNQHYLDTFHALYGYESQFYQADILTEIKKINPQDWLEEALNPAFSSHLLARLRRATLMLKGAQNIQPRANNLALSQGLWVRSPFCDLELTKWAFQLPGEFCLQGACEKYILKKAVESWLPPEIVWREKQGMAIPVTTLCLNSLQKQVKTWLSPSRLKKQGIWDKHIAFKVINGKLGGNIRGGRIGRILWLLMMWQVWYNTIFDDQNKFGTKISNFIEDIISL